MAKYRGLYSAKLSDSLVENYSTKPRTNMRVVVILPELDYTTINSLLDQTVRVHQFAFTCMNKPQNFEKFDSVVNLFTCGKRYENRIYPTLLRERENSTVLINVESGVVYGSDFIESIIACSDKYPEMAIISNKAYLSKIGFYNDKGQLIVPHKHHRYLENY